MRVSRRLRVASICIGLLGFFGLPGVARPETPIEVSRAHRAITGGVDHYPEAFDIAVHEWPDQSLVTVTYKIRTPHPASDVVDYYAAQLRSSGWQGLDRPRGRDGTDPWRCFQDGTKSGMPVVHEYSATWLNDTQTRGLLLLLQYRSSDLHGPRARCEQGPGSEVLYVTVQLMPASPLLPQSDAAPPDSHDDRQ